MFLNIIGCFNALPPLLKMSSNQMMKNKQYEKNTNDNKKYNNYTSKTNNNVICFNMSGPKIFFHTRSTNVCTNIYTKSKRLRK